MDAAEDFASLLHAVTDDPALAVRANRRQRVDRALEAIEGVVLAGNNHLKGLVIFIFTNFTCSHTKSLSRTAAFAAVSAFFFASERTVITFLTCPRQLLESRDRTGK